MKEFVINGRPCTIVYMNDKREVVPEAKATQAIARFNDGGVAYYSLKKVLP